MKTLGLITAACLGAVCAGVVWAADEKPAAPPAQSIVAASCQKCHGPTGDSESYVYPRLNAQQAAYIAAQLKNFRDHKRDDTHARGFMWGKARTLDDKTMGEIGQYFASQKPTLPQTGGALAADGQKLFDQACQQCHGRNGEGSGATPRIAGQHAAYFRMVMGGFRSGLRRNATMNAASKTLTDRQIDALASYLSND